MMVCIYIAGKLYTPYERSFLEMIAEKLEAKGIKVILPHRDVGIALDPQKHYRNIFTKDITYIDICDILIAILDMMNIDDGTSFEIGYAYSKGKKIIGIITDFRKQEPFILNPMILCSLDCLIMIGSTEVSFNSLDNIVKDIVTRIMAYTFKGVCEYDTRKLC